MGQNMTTAQAQTMERDLPQERNNTAGKKKASWLRTVLWMLSMVLLSNVVMAIIAYFLFFNDK